MITVGSISRDEAAEVFEFLREQIRGRRALIKTFTHTQPDFVSGSIRMGHIHDAKDAHRKNFPKGYGHILEDEPDYGGFLRGRVETKDDWQLIVIYCRSEALVNDPKKIHQFLLGISQLPIPFCDKVLVVSDNGDMYGTLQDIEERLNVS